MASPRYKSRSHYQTRHSAGEKSSLEPSTDFGATSLDRPRIDISALPPRTSATAMLPVQPRPDIAAPERRARTIAWLLTSVLIACAFMGVVFGTALALARCT